MKNIKTLLGTAFLATAVSMTGCVVHTEQPHSSRGYGPPPHAPAHGYRHKYHDHDLEFDANLGVYIVVGLVGIYFLDELFYRHDHDGWYSSRRYDGDWKPDKDGRLPPGLAKKYGDDDKHGKKGDNHGHDDDDDHGHGQDKDKGKGDKH